MRYIFIPIAVLIYSAMCFYIGIRLFVLISHFFPGLPVIAYWIVFAVLCFGLVFISFGGGNSSVNLSILRRAGSVWMAVFFYMLMLLAVSDFIRLCLHIFGKHIDNLIVYTAGQSVFLCVILIVFGILNARTIKTVNYDVVLAGGGKDIKIALISDIHIGSSIGKSHIEKIVKEIDAVKPDIVCIAGDIFDGNVNGIDDLPAVVSALGELKAPLGVYACLGNHDVDRMLGSGGTGQIENVLSSTGIVVLRDETYKIADGLYIAGRKDARPIGMNEQRLSAQELIAGIDGTIIMLDHQPVDFASIEKTGVDLILCGHTHRGQIFPATVFTRFIFKRAGAVYYGYWKGKDSQVQAVVTSGVGYWGPPLRIGTNNEIAVINVNFMLN